MPVGEKSGALSDVAAKIAATVRMSKELKEALIEHASQSGQAGFEAYSIAVAIREANPPVDAIPLIIRDLPRLAEYTQGSIRDVEREIKKLYRHFDE